MMICDAQIHAPNPAIAGPVPGIEYDELVAEMLRVGVDRAILVPLTTDPQPSLEFMRKDPARFRVIGLLPLQEGSRAIATIESWKGTAGILGIRAACGREPNRSLLAEDKLDWLWESAEQVGVPIMINAPGNVHKVGQIAARHEDLRLVVDHMGVISHTIYDDFTPLLNILVPLAQYPNVAVKASALPCAVEESFPFPSLHSPIQRLVEAFGARRVFWGSDLTRLPCKYEHCLRLFTDELLFLTDDDKDWIMGRAVCDWLGWGPD